MVVGGVKMEKNKIKAVGDVTYCVSKECKDRCWRHVDNYVFDDPCRLYSMMAECEKQRKKNTRK